MDPPKPSKFLETLFKNLNIPLSFLTKKSLFCPHSDGCIENILKSTVTSFKYGYILRSVISLVGALMQLKSGKIGYFIRKKR
jgi:hypothetical protein